MDFTNYKTSELRQAVDLDSFGVRDEAYARQEKLLKQIESAKAKIAKLLAEVADCGKAIQAAQNYENAR